MRKNISAIICAFNEEKTIREVISTIALSNIVEEIIIVNDGSTDETKNIITDVKNTFNSFNTIKRINMIDIHISENQGKGFAMALGVERANSEILLFCDADLSGLNIYHFIQLTSPIILKEADMVLGQATETLINYKINPFEIPYGRKSSL